MPSIPSGQSAHLNYRRWFAGALGLAGLAYWYALWGIHQLVFAGMLRNIARAVGFETSRAA